jgi:cyclopropane-fatty-acyl-phospholipid synthase
MTSARTDIATIAGSVRGTLPASGAARVGMLERAGRAITRRALARLSYGSIELHDAQGVHRYGVDIGPRVRMTLTGEGVYAAIAFRGAMGAAEAYIDGLWTTDDLPGLIEILTTNYASLRSLDRAIAKLAAPVERGRYWLRRNTRGGSKRNILAHYDLSNEFFSLFLDPSMTYSSAIFTPEAASLEAAQTEKIDRACRHLDLKPTDHLVEIGTGWGAMAIHAASRYGCRVTTTTISDNQHAEAVRRIAHAGLSDRITVLKADYRDLARDHAGRFDKLVSIEMIEAVGHEFHDGYFRAVSGLLKPDGAALIQAIVIRDQFYDAARRRVDFLKRYIFPGSCLLGVERMLGCVRRRTDLSVRSVEDIGQHYVRTLAMWRAAFLARRDQVRALGFDERFIRMWDYYLAYCEGVFRTGHCSDVQMLLTKPRARLASLMPSAPTR